MGFTPARLPADAGVDAAMIDPRRQSLIERYFRVFWDPKPLLAGLGA